MLAPGDRVGDYEVVAHLGSGAIADVYEVSGGGVFETRAMKILREDERLTPEWQERFLREFRIQANIDHPNVVKPHELIPDGSGGTAIVMELVLGARPLQDAIDGSDLGEAASSLLQAMYGLKQIAGAEAGESAVHRDLSPKNLLVDASGRLKIADFGLARDQSSDALTATGRTIGTPGYIAPEQDNDPSAVDVRADLWTVGRSFAVALQRRQAEHLDLSLLPEPFRSIISSMSAYDPEHRYENATACISHAFGLFGQGGIVPADMPYHASRLGVEYEWSDGQAVFERYFSQGPFEAAHFETAYTVGEHLAPLSASGAVVPDVWFTKLDSGPVTKEFGGGGATFARCDRVAALYGNAYTHLSEENRIRAARRLFDIGAAYHRFSAMYAVRGLYTKENAPSVKDRLVQLHASEPRYSVINFP